MSAGKKVRFGSDPRLAVTIYNVITIDVILPHLLVHRVVPLPNNEFIWDNYKYLIRPPNPRARQRIALADGRWPYHVNTNPKKNRETFLLWKREVLVVNVAVTVVRGSSSHWQVYVSTNIDQRKVKRLDLYETAAVTARANGKGARQCWMVRSGWH